MRWPRLAFRSKSRWIAELAETGYTGSQAKQPFTEPGAFKPGMPGHEDVAPSKGSPEFIYHVFHGAWPVLQRSSSWILSRKCRELPKPK